MNIKEAAKQWLLEHEHYEHDSHFNKDLKSLCTLIESFASEDAILNGDSQYDPKFGDHLLCACGHVYYRHFDTYDGMRPVGCKYCYASDTYGNGRCAGFQLVEKA